jgi:uncharacterized protein (TIGR03437 family)
MRRPCVLASALVLAAMLSPAAPMLRLATRQVGPISVAANADGPVQTVEAYNAGDGSLEPLVLTPSASWLSASALSARPCAASAAGCIPVRIELRTASLPKGKYTGSVTVGHPTAWDAPQRIAVIVLVGGGTPDQVSFFAAPGGAADSRTFVANNPLTVIVKTQTGGNWLSVVRDCPGMFDYAASCTAYRIQAQPLSGMAGRYEGSVTVSGSAVPDENKTIAVSFMVTPWPVLNLTPDSLRLSVARDAAPATAYVSWSNRGQGSLGLPGVSVDSGGSPAPWLRVEVLPASNTVAVSADPAGLAPGVYRASILFRSNAANGDVSLPMELEVAFTSPPQAAFRGTVSAATFAQGEAVARGDIVAVFGEQFTTKPPAGAGAVPLPLELAGARAFVNGIPAPLYYVSAGQINLQIPIETRPGLAAVAIERDGVRGNTVTVQVADCAPRLFRAGVGDYGIVLNLDNTLAMRATPGIPSRPARRGEVIVLYALGLGDTYPSVPTGAPAPDREPLGRAVATPRVHFGGNIIEPSVAVEPVFAGLTPALVALYQINVEVPLTLAPGSSVPLCIRSGGERSNQVTIAIE